MRYTLIAAIAALTLSSLPALADQNFIPIGEDYSIGKDGVPPINSKESQFNAQVDVYQTEVYQRNLDRKVFESQLYNLQNDQSPEALDDNKLDY